MAILTTRQWSSAEESLALVSPGGVTQGITISEILSSMLLINVLLPINKQEQMHKLFTLSEYPDKIRTVLFWSPKQRTCGSLHQNQCLLPTHFQLIHWYHEIGKPWLPHGSSLCISALKNSSHMKPPTHRWSEIIFGLVKGRGETCHRPVYPSAERFPLFLKPKQHHYCCSDWVNVV